MTKPVKFAGSAFRNYGYFIIACLCLLLGCTFSTMLVDFPNSTAYGQSLLSLRAVVLSGLVLAAGILVAALTRTGFCAMLFLYGLSYAGCVSLLAERFGGAAAAACCFCFLPRCCLLCWIAFDLCRRCRVALYLLLTALLLAAQYFLGPVLLLPLLTQ